MRQSRECGVGDMNPEFSPCAVLQPARPNRQGDRASRSSNGAGFLFRDSLIRHAANRRFFLSF
jgi:hypothetical protein